MPFLEVTNIYKEYAGTPLLRGATFTVECGEIACLLGPSGSGKTTLLRLLAGLEPASAGQIRLGDQDLAGIPTHRRGIVLMFQEYALFPHKTVAENIAFGLQDGKWRLKANARQAQHHAVTLRVAEMLALVGLEEFGEREVISLSGGEQQRVALARSLAPHPRLLLLDEPLGALDRNLRERLMAELPAILHRVGVTALTVTHDQEEAFARADRVILLHEGRVVQAGQPEEVYQAPADAWVAQFLGLTNLVAAQVVSQRPARVRTSFGELTLAAHCALPAPKTEGTLLIHPWGIHETASQTTPYTGTITRRTFHGSYYRLEIELTGYKLTLKLPANQKPPAPGDSIVLQIDSAALCWLGVGTSVSS